MASPHPGRRVRRLIVAAVAIAAAVTVLEASQAGATPHKPQPTIASTLTQLDKLANKTEVLTEKYNAAAIDLQRKQSAAIVAQRTAVATARNYQIARAPLMVIAVAQYQNAPASNVGALLTSEDQQAYLEALATRAEITSRFAKLAADVQAAKTVADQAAKNAHAAWKAARTASKTLAAQGEKVQTLTGKYRALLATLTAPQQQSYASFDTPTRAQIQKAFDTPAPTGAAQKAVNFAIAQIGKPYVWAAAGPDSYDCSGLTMAAWRQGGVILPHLSQAQWLFGRHVSYDQMQPGDLVFMYSDIHHVELYIGNGLAVNAPTEGENVKIVKVYNDADFHGATRLR